MAANSVLKRGASARLVVWIVAGGLLLTVPLWLRNPYYLRIVTLVLLYIIPGLAQNLIIGYAGILSFGSAANLALGAYTSILLVMRLGVPWPLAFLIAATVSGVFGLLLGLPCLRLGGDYLSLMTLGFAEIVRIVATNWLKVTGGPQGISKVPSPQIGSLVINTPTKYFYLMLFMAAAAYFVAHRIVNSYMGRALTAIRDDEIAASAMGVSLTRYKLMAFVVSTVYLGFAGSLLAHYLHYAGPQNFTMDESLLHMQIAILGGLGSLPGTVLGAVIMVSLPELLRVLQSYRMLFNGLMLVAMMTWRPQGILGVGAWGRGGTGWSKILKLPGHSAGEAPTEKSSNA